MAALAVNGAHAGLTIDFETEDDFVTALADGQIIDSEFGNLISITHLNGGAGLSIYDTNQTGGNDPDLEVDLGNALIVQEDQGGFGTNDGSFFTNGGNDAGLSGGASAMFMIDFLGGVVPTAITLIDIDDSGDQTVVLELTDGSGFMRTYNVPTSWTNDVFDDGPVGYQVLDLTTLAGQLGEAGSTATATEDAGFDGDTVVSMKVTVNGSAGFDNIELVPAPSALVALAAGFGVMTRRRRRA
jgi:hypothetical protein